MHVIVLGAGVIGVTTAYYLAELGCQVTVIDRAEAVASGASYANAGQLSYSFTDSLAKPEFLATLPRLLAGMDPGVSMRMAPDLFVWASRFLAQCTSRRSTRNTLALLDYAMRSAKLLSTLREKVPFEFSYRPAGKLLLLSDPNQLRNAETTTELKKQNGSDVEILSAKDAVAIEPALRSMADSLCGAVYSQSDEVGDAHQFVIGLQESLEATGNVEFRMATTAEEILVSQGRVSGVRCGENLRCDAVVVALGAWSGDLLRSVGVNPYIYPVRGYSVTLPVGPDAPSVSVTSLQHRIVFSRINGSMRIAGFADFNGFDQSADDQRVDTLLHTAKKLAPEAADYSASENYPWGGFRPMTPNGRPRVGKTSVQGLYLNAGHGMLGWTLACATGQDAARAVTKNQ